MLIIDIPATTRRIPARDEVFTDPAMSVMGMMLTAAMALGKPGFLESFWA